MWIIVLLVAVVIVLGYHVYKRGAEATWKEFTALVGTVAAAVWAFWESFGVPS